MVVAFQQVEGTDRQARQMRAFRHAATGMSVDEILAEPRYGTRLPYYWCAADKPEHLEVVPIYLGTDVPQDARCQECHIEIRDLQTSLRDLGRDS